LLVLLLQRQEAADFAEIGVVFQADEPILPEIAGKSNGRREIGLAARPEAYVDNRIDDKFPLLVTDPMIGLIFKSPGGGREARQFIAKLEVNAIEDTSFGGVGNDKEAADFGAVR
jgi:hypothetical protein